MGHISTLNGWKDRIPHSRLNLVKSEERGQGCGRPSEASRATDKLQPVGQQPGGGGRSQRGRVRAHHAAKGQTLPWELIPEQQLELTTGQLSGVGGGGCSDRPNRAKDCGSSVS